MIGVVTNKDRTNKASPRPRFRSLIDLGTASVKALIIELRGGQIHLWGHGLASLEGGYGPDGEIVDREAVAAACEAALSTAEEMTLDTFGHKIVPDQSVWSVPGWLCQGQVLAFQQRRSHPTKRISRREWQALQTRLDRAVTRLAGVPVDVVPTAQLDDSTVTDVLGLRGETLTLWAFVTTASPSALAALQEVAVTLELDPPTFVSQARATTAGLCHDGVLLDVGRWGTGVTVARLGQLTGTAWTPMGGQSFYRTLSNGFGLAPSQLPAFCQAYAEGWLPPETRMAADAALVDPVTRWLDLVAGQLASLTIGQGLAAKIRLPHQIFLAGGASPLPAMLQGARRYAWMRQPLTMGQGRWFPWSRHPEVRAWQASTVSGLINHADRDWGASDLVRLGLTRLAQDVG